MASVASLRLGRVTVALNKNVKATEVSRIVGLVKGKYGCLACGFVGKLRDIAGIRETINKIKSVDRVSITLR